VTLREWEEDADGITAQAAARFGFPCVVKSPCQGSSVGMAIPRDEAAFRNSIPEVFAYGDVLMIEKFIRGAEVTCAVLDVDAAAPPVALPVTEIRPVSSAYFDYQAKYTPGASIEITPAEISAELTRKVQETAVRAHQLIGCSIWSRSDFIIDAEEPIWLEVNTVPGMTGTSLYPQAAAAAGISYEQLVGLFVEAAIAKRGTSLKGR
jgi:D-alanine-D-alanine ligase